MNVFQFSTDVRDDLSDAYLQNLGEYIQLIARIEYLVASTICALEKRPRHSDEWGQRHNELRRKPTSELISALNKAAGKSNLPESKKRTLASEAGWMHRFKENRHAAIHAVHTIVEGQLVLSKGEQGNRIQTQELELGKVGELVQDAKRIIHELSKAEADLHDAL